MELFHIGHIPPSSGWWMKPQIHPDINELIIPLQGKMTLGYEGQEKEVGVGDLMLYSRNCLHEERSSPKDPIELIFFAFAEDLDDRIRVLKDDGGRVRQITRWLWEEHQAGRQELAEDYFQVIIGEIKKLLSDKPLADLVFKSQNFMRQHLHQLITLEELAKQVNMSKYHFLREYKKETGFTPLEDFRKLRLQKATELLQKTNLPLKAIAEMTGFANEYHFSREFKRRMNRRPGAYRK